MKLKAVIVDDEPEVFTVIKDFCKGSPLMEIVGTFTDPVEFLEAAPTIDFDIALLDIQMDKMLGTQVASKLNNKAVIYVTGAFNHLKDAIRTPYAGVVLKPIEKHLFDATIEKAHAFVLSKLGKPDKPEHKVFDTANGKKKVKLRLKDIFLVTTDIVNYRHKHLFIRGDQHYEITDFSLEEFLELSPDLIQVNKSELVAIEAVQEIAGNDGILILKDIMENRKPKEVILARSFKKNFMERLAKA